MIGKKSIRLADRHTAMQINESSIEQFCREEYARLYQYAYAYRLWQAGRFAGMNAPRCCSGWLSAPKMSSTQA
jgi:hypothetical protein